MDKVGNRGVAITTEYEEGIDLWWHFEGEQVVIDRWNIGGKPAPFDAETFDLLFPAWMRESIKA